MALTYNSTLTPQAPCAGTAVVTTANATYTDAPTNTVLIDIKAKGATPSDGMRLTKVSALARATPTATECQLYSSPDAGATKRFIKSALMAAYTVAGSTAQAVADFGYSDTSPLILAAGESLWAGIGVTNTGIVFRAEGGAY